MRILVTGGAGFIGSHITEKLCRDGHDVTVVDSLRTGFISNLSSLPAQFIQGDIRDAELLSNLGGEFSSIFHLAALISVPESLERIEECISINAQGTINVLNLARQSGAKVVLSSSAAIYGENPDLPKQESMLAEPLTPYAVTKLDGEYYLDIYTRTWQVPTIALRYFNVFGPRQNPKSQYAAAVPIFIVNALRNQPITIYGDGEQTRDFIYVKDVVNANLLGSTNGSGIFNVAYGTSTSINELAHQIIHITNSKSSIVYEDVRAGDVKHSVADTSRIQSLGFRGDYSLELGLTETIKYYESELRKM